MNADVVWLINSLDDIMLEFEKNKPNILALDDQNERIAKLRQKDSMDNEAFVKLMQKEVKIYEKHGGVYLWGKEQEDEVTLMMTKVLKDYESDQGSPMSEEKKSEESTRITNIVKEKVLSMAMIKRSCTKRYRTLKINLQNSYLTGRNEYPTTIADALH